MGLTPPYVNLKIVYTCDSMDEHTFVEEIEDITEVLDYAYEDADECPRCREFGQVSRVTIDRVEFEE